MGDKQFRFVAGVSYRFRQLYLETLEGETLTSIKCSFTFAELYLGRKGKGDSVELMTA